MNGERWETVAHGAAGGGSGRIFLKGSLKMCSLNGLVVTVKAFNSKILWDDPQKLRRQRNVNANKCKEKQRLRVQREIERWDRKTEMKSRDTFSITPHEKVFSTASFALWEQKERVRLQLYFIYPSSSPPSLLFIHHHTLTLLSLSLSLSL